MEPVWLFDYDRTLYGPSEEHVFASVNAAISRYIARRLRCPPAEADHLRVRLCEAHGSTIRGLAHEHDLDPDAIFDEVHADPRLAVPRPNPALDRALASLPGDRHVFTNSRADWARRGLAALGVAARFDRVYDLRFAGWQGKPDPTIYARVAEDLGVRDERRIVFVDDSLANLAPACARGWRCIWAHPPGDGTLPDGIETIAAIEAIAPLP